MGLLCDATGRHPIVWAQEICHTAKLFIKESARFSAKLVTCSLTILARFARADVNALSIMHLDFDGLVATVVTDIKAHIVTTFFQVADDFIWNSTLDFNVTAAPHFIASWFVIALVLPARSVARFLHVQAKIDLIRQDLDVSLWLHSATHHAKDFPRFPIPDHKTRNDSVERTVTRGMNIGVAGFHREKLATILKHEAESRHNNPAAHAAIIALNERDHIALIVRRAHVNSVAVFQHPARNWNIGLWPVRQADTLSSVRCH